jgi:N-acetylmuramoyl-L-alanine amidase
LRKIDAIVIHCTAHPDTAFGVGVAEIRRDHINERGWDDVGYHFVVRRNGEIECGRMESVKGAHCPPMNGSSLAIAWVGISLPTSQQWSSMVRLTKELMARYSVPTHRVYGHKEADPACGKSCPVLNMMTFRTEVSK